MRDLTIANTTIRTDADGRYCLNDLHRAAGGEPRHTPGRFTITQQFTELANELSRNQDSPEPCTSAAGIGTFVAKELVYAYAMWISAAFHLKVIRAYDTMVNAPQAPAVLNLRDPKTLAAVAVQLLEVNQELQQRIDTQQAALVEAEPKVQFANQVSTIPGCITIEQAAKTLGTGERRLFKWLRDQHLLTAANLPYQRHIDAGLFRLEMRTVRVAENTTKPYFVALLTGKGMQTVYRRMSETSSQLKLQNLKFQ